MKNFLLAFFLGFVSLAFGQVPNMINYQGVARNSVGNVLPNKKLAVRLSIHEGDASGVIVYKETRTITTNSFGLFTIAIGSTGATNVSGTISGIDWSGAAKFIQVEIDPDGGSNFTNMGAAQLLSVPYALYAGSSNTGTPTGVAGGVLTGNYPNPSIANGAITQSMIAAGVIPTSLPPGGTAGGDLNGTYPNPTINTGAITTNKLADNSVTTSKIIDASVTSAKLAAGVIPTSLPPSGTAGGDLSGSYPNPTINNGVITTSKLADNSVTTSKIVDASVTSAKLAAGVIPTSLPPSGTAGGDLTGSYPNPTINNGVVTTTKLADNSVTTSKIVDASVTSAKLAAGVIPASLPPSGTAGGDLTGSYPNPLVSRIQNTAVSNTAPVNGQVLKFNGAQWVPATDDVGSGGGSNPTGPAGGDLSGIYPDPNIASGAVTSPKIANGAVNTPKLADGAVSSNKLADLSITTIKIADASVTSAKLAAGVIPTSLPPSGTAGGDLTGSYPNPSVNKVQGIIVTTTGATTGQVLKFDGTSWVPGADNSGGGGGSPTGPAGGDLTGSYPNPTVNTGAITTTKLADNSVTTSKIVDASVTSAKLAAGVIPTSLPPSGTAGGDLNGSYPNPTVNTGAITTTKLADNSVTTAKIVDASVTSAKLAAGVIPTSLPPSGTAGGDLNGSYPNPTLSKIQGINITATGASTGQVLKFDGTSWVPGVDNSGSGGSNPTGPAGGDLTGSYPNPTINTGVVTTTKLADNSVTTSKIVDASVTSAKLAAGVIPTTLPPSGSAGGDLTGSYPNPTINTGAVTTTKLADNSVTTAKIVDASVTSAKLAAGVIPTSLPPSGSAGGDLAGSYPTPTVSKIQGIGVTNTGLASGMVLKYDGTQWAPAADNTGSLTLPYSASVSSASNLLSITNTGTGAAAEFAISNLLNTVDVVSMNHLGDGRGLYASSENNRAIEGQTNNGDASIIGFNNAWGNGVWGVAGSGAGIKGTSRVTGGTAVEGELQNVASGTLAVFKVDGVNKARIDDTGKGFFNGGTQNSGADVAEAFDVEGNFNGYEPGDVLIISQSSDRKVEKSNTAYSTLVAGVYATKPGVLLTEENIEADLTNKVPMGVIGVIPTKVCLEGGSIKRGDLLVTSSVAGVAMKADPDKVKVGQVLGKALEDYSANSIGKIKVLVSIK